MGSGNFTSGDAQSFSGLTSKLPPLGSMSLTLTSTKRLRVTNVKTTVDVVCSPILCRSSSRGYPGCTQGYRECCSTKHLLNTMLTPHHRHKSLCVIFVEIGVAAPSEPCLLGPSPGSGSGPGSRCCSLSPGAVGISPVHLRSPGLACYRARVP